METKCIVLGQTKEPIKLKPIKFISFLTSSRIINNNPTVLPTQYKNIELIARKDDHDIMFAYNDDRNIGVLYLGHWNDGVVE